MRRRTFTHPADDGAPDAIVACRLDLIDANLSQRRAVSLIHFGVLTNGPVSLSYVLAIHGDAFTPECASDAAQLIAHLSKIIPH